jgi:hypothetical protein|tara:strand:+ start:1080 stop:1310 length:231 start_codon:yes stop_codon:yes gene_type:complete
MNNAMDPNFRYYDCKNIVDEITGEEQDNLTIMVAVPRIDLNTPEDRQENIVAISGVVEQQYRNGVQSFTYEEYKGE